MHRLLRYVIFGLLILAGVKGAYHLLAQSYFFMGGAASGDAKYYWTVGQAIQNGFTLYRETFDTKPPAIYLLSTLPHVIGNILNGLMTLALPSLIALTAWKVTGKKLHTGIALLFGGALTLYMGTQAEAWQVEWYGGFFGLMYVCLLAAYPERTDKKMIALLSATMIGAIGFKEPFFLSIVAAGLILLPTKKLLVRKLLLPLGITAVFGVMALLLLGSFGGYIDTYLPSQFGHHMLRAIPMHLRGIQVGVVGFYLWQFSLAFVAVITVLILSAGTIRYTQQKWIALLVAIASLYLVTLAGNLRGFPVNNHFVVAVPYYGALFFVWLKYARGLSAFVLPVLLAITLLWLPLSIGFPAYSARLQEQAMETQRNQTDAKLLDSILDACAIDRYFFVEDRPYMEHMQHSPLNFFVYVGPEAIVYHSPILIEKQLDSFSQASVVIAQGDAYELRARPEEKTLTEMTFRYLANNFTITPWECAEGLVFPENYSVLFRKNPDDMQPFPYTMK